MLFGEDDEWLAPVAQRLAAQQMKILHRIRGLANLEIIAGRSCKTFRPGARMFRSLAFVAVGQKQHHTRERSPFIFAGA